MDAFAQGLSEKELNSSLYSESDVPIVAIGAALFDLDIKHIARFGYHNGNLILDSSNTVRMNALVLEDRAYHSRIPDSFDKIMKGRVEGIETTKPVSSDYFMKTGFREILLKYKIHHLIKKPLDEAEILKNHFNFLKQYTPPNMWEKLQPFEPTGHSVLEPHPHPPTVFLQYNDGIRKYIPFGYEFGDSVIIYGRELTSSGKKKLSTLEKYNLNSGGGKKEI